MARYKVQGPNGEIITIEGPDGANPDDVIAQAQALYRPREKTTTDYVKDFGKATASMADTGLNMVTGALDYAAYPLARAFGRTPEQATAETTSPKDVFGTAFGITQDPAYRGEASRRAMGAVGEGVQAVARPIASATGLPGSDVENMIGSGLLGAGVRAQPYINRGAQAVGQAMYAAEPYVAAAVKAPVKAPVQFGRGLVEGLVNKEYNPATSAQAALQNTYIPPAAAQRFMGEVPGVPKQTLSQLESQARPTAELVGSTAGRVAQAVSPKTTTGQTLVPLRGQGMQAFGERVGRGVRTNPLQALGEVGVTALTGIPFKTLAQGVGELGARYLGNKTGFAPGFETQVGAAQAQAALQPTQPRLGYTPPVAGPVAPNTIYAGPGGASTDLAAAGRAALNEKYPPMPAREPPPPQTSQTPFEAVREAAAARITPPKTPEQQAILDRIRARAQASGAKYTPPQVDTPTVAPVPPQELPPAPPPAAASTLDQLRSRLTPQTPEQQAAVEAYNALSPAEKARQTRAENAAKKGPPGVIEMKTGNGAPGTWDNPMSHVDAMKQFTYDQMASKPNNIVGQTSDGTITYKVHDINSKMGRKSNIYVETDPVTKREVYSVEFNQYRVGDSSTLVKDRTGYDYNFADGKLNKIVTPEGRTLFPGDPEWAKQPKITEPSVIDLISKIQE
jgi:hypothetical protein